jgi:hypothetical protein
MISERQPSRTLFEDCIRCGDAPAVDLYGYCGHCHWVVRAECRNGLAQFDVYLLAWSRFAEWCGARGQSTH